MVRITLTNSESMSMGLLSDMGKGTRESPGPTTKGNGQALSRISVTNGPSPDSDNCRGFNIARLLLKIPIFYIFTNKIGPDKRIVSFPLFLQKYPSHVLKYFPVGLKSNLCDNMIMSVKYFWVTELSFFPQ